jgi:hypothetical protein
VEPPDPVEQLKSAQHASASEVRKYVPTMSTSNRPIGMFHTNGGASDRWLPAGAILQIPRACDKHVAVVSGLSMTIS